MSFSMFVLQFCLCQAILSPDHLSITTSRGIGKFQLITQFYLPDAISDFPIFSALSSIIIPSFPTLFVPSSMRFQKTVFSQLLPVKGLIGKDRLSFLYQSLPMSSILPKLHSKTSLVFPFLILDNWNRNKLICL